MQIPCKCATIFMNIWNSYIWTSYQELNPFTSFFVTSHAITKSPFGQRLAAKLFAKLRRTAVSPVHLPFWPVVSQYLRLRFRWFSLAGPKRLIKKKKEQFGPICGPNFSPQFRFLLRFSVESLDTDLATFWVFVFLKNEKRSMQQSMHFEVWETIWVSNQYRDPIPLGTWL